ncbi:YfhO family protein [bacterium]|nr:YfhO family protein [bacterium]
MNNKLYNLIAIILFTILALIVTFPVIFNMSKLIYGYPDDTIGTLSCIWYYKFAVLHHFNPCINFHVGFPFEESSLGSGAIIEKIITGPIAILTSEIFTWNLFSILNFALSAILMYSLVRYLTDNKISAFISGIIYGFCPHICMQSFNHIQIAAIQWMPLYILFLMKLLFEKNYKNALFCGIFYALVLLSNAYYGYYMLLFTVIFIVFLVLKHIKNPGAVIKKNRFKILKLAGVGFLTSLIIIIPYEYKIIKPIFSKDKNNPAVFNRPLQGLIFSAARPKDFLLPPRTNPVLKNISKPFMSPDFGSMIDHTLYLGYTPLILSIIAAGFWWKRREKEKGKMGKFNFVVPFFVAVFFVFGIMSSPPWIPIGAAKLNSAPFKLPMPSYFLHKIFPMFRYYSRMVVVMMISLSVLSGIGIKFLLEKFKIKNLKLKIIFAGIIFVLIGIEYVNIPPFHYFDSTPPEVYTWLAKQDGEFSSAIAEYPMLAGRTPEYGYLFWQRVHKQKLVNGGDRARLMKLLYIDNSKIVNQLREWGVKYVIIHRDLYKDYEKDYNIPMPIIDEEKLGLRLIRAFDQKKNKNYKEQYFSPNMYFDKFFGKTDVYKIK